MNFVFVTSEPIYNIYFQSRALNGIIGRSARRINQRPLHYTYGIIQARLVVIIAPHRRRIGVAVALTSYINIGARAAAAAAGPDVLTIFRRTRYEREN